ncbi:LPD3 domain-containing protein [Avibacterium paragallinarum]|uniref:LPD3 domain-containing protein n=2 Tax=Avibacterium paragallinarum TaxID=728 RepID=UPI00021ACDB5|nr:hypothetical protein [Avibacterium paragallinarum]QIR11169.1 hypothetical protein HBL79_02305 [Avibacterium paragallinarum]QJE10010.1 hypothetical protein HHJ62_06720 [Avibacterium paragallinarum]QJE12205.1 hypothetical protein HHJ61_06725 [Avibacterium paragallinarum]QJE14406.1 hypothetical protein HHJ60_06740 [Avibacterium paragallinarum]QJE16606.1 hypothetical protein HHJ59_06730 [Avibacterium paragallinarum]
MALNLTFWDNQQNPVNTTVEQLFDALRNDDMKAGLMYEPCTMDDVLDGTEPSNALIMDAIIAQYAKLTAKMNIMQRVMSRSGVDVKDSEGKTVPLTVVGYQISDPFMRLGTANVVALFELSDGQTVSIYFHNPDTTPKKITPQDEVISFKWLLNKKDITIVVAPEKGKDIDVRQVALRIMKIAAKNSAAFARQNKNRKERLERVNALRTRVAEKEKILAQKLKKIDELQYLKAQEEVDQLLEDERLMDSELNASLYAELKALDRLSDREDELDNIYQARVVAVRNMLRDKGWKGESYKELSKEGYVLTETYHYSKSGTNMIGVTYSIPELNLSYTDELTDTPEAIAEMINEPVDKALKALRLSQVESDKEEDKEQPIAISGKEFGEFDTESEEGKTKFRMAVREYLENNLKGKWIRNKALDQDIEIRQRGINELIAWSANPKKLQIAAVIEQVIATAKPKNGIAAWEENTKKGKKRNVKGYYRFANSVNIAGENVNFDVLIEQDEKGLLHYDFILPRKSKAIMDNIDIGSDTYPEKDQSTITAFARENNNIILDEAQEEYMINIILLDEKGDVIEEEEGSVQVEKTEDKLQEDQPIVISGKEFGEFDTETEEGKKALRSKVLEHLTETLKGKWVKNLFLDRDIEIRKRGIKKTLANSANPLKLKALAQLEEIIKTAKGSKDYIQDNFKSDKKPNVLRYFHLENHVLVDNRPLKINVVIEEDTNGLLHYDLTLEKNKVALDSIEPFLNTIPGTFNAKSATGNSIENLEGECNSKDGFDAIMDSIEMKKVGSYEANKSSVSNLYQAQSSELLLDNIAILDGIDVEKATNLPSKYGESRLIQAQSELQPDNTAILNGKQVKNSLNPLLLDDTQQANLMIALNYAATLDDGLVIDATQLAQDQLEAALSVLENNLPINEQEGNIAQAELEREHIASIKEALSVSQSQPALDGVDDDGYVLNLFVEYKDENGNWVELKDEDEEVEPENSNAQPENIQSEPVLLHTSLLYKGEGYRPFLPGRDEEIEQFKQAGYTLEPFSVEGRSCTYSVHKTAEPYNIHITANWYSDGKKSYWVNVSPQKGYVTDAKENNGGQAKVSGANENAKSVTDAIQLAEELIQEEKHYRPLRKEKGYISGTYFATKGRSKTYFFYVSQNLETLKYRAYIQWSSGEPKEMTFDSLTELKEGVENYFRAYVKGTLPEITLSSGTDILEINANKEDQETTVESEQSNAVGETLPELVLPENANRETLNAIAQDYLKAHLQGKRIKTSDGKIVHFNRDQSVEHFSFNAQVGELETKALTKIAEVFSQGIFVGREETYKERKDKFIAFHVYQKQVEIDGMKLLLQTKAGEKENGELEVTGKLIGYTHKLLDNAESNSDGAPPVLTSPNGERPSGGYAIADNKGTLFLDETQEEIADYLVEILEIRDKYGNLIDLDRLGAEQGNAIENNVEENLPELVLPENASRKALSTAVEKWLKANLQGKTIRTVDGKEVRFNSKQSVKHLVSDGRKGKLNAIAVSKIVEVFTTGNAQDREELTKPRKDFVAFHRYDKWLDIDGMKVLAVAKAGEKENGELEAFEELIAYSSAVYKTTLDNAFQSLGRNNTQAGNFNYAEGGLHNNTAILDDSQEDEPLATLTILEIRDKNGNLIDLDQLEAEEGSSMENNVEENAQKQADIQFLQDVIEGNVNVFDATFNAKLSEIASRLQSSNIELVQQAANAYVSKMTEKARQA